MAKITFISILLLLTACSKEHDMDTEMVDTSPLPNDKTTWWRPSVGESFDWVLDDLRTGDAFTADIVDVDAFTTTGEQVTALHAQGKKVIAYISFGTIENDRSDAGLLPGEVIGSKYPEWPDEKWIDIRQLEKIKPWLNSRFNMVLRKGFDAIEPDNLDSYSNATGFNINIADARQYCDLLIAMAHRNGLGIGQKNVPELAGAYSDKFDWILTEDAFHQGWQTEVSVYIGKGKPVFAVEYTDELSQKKFERDVCPSARNMRYTAILKKRETG